MSPDENINKGVAETAPLRLLMKAYCHGPLPRSSIILEQTNARTIFVLFDKRPLSHDTLINT